jgi:hypothetical protein
MAITDKEQIIGWKVWYEDGQVFDAKTYEWKNIPDDGVLLVMLYQEKRDTSGYRYRIIHQGNDYYWTTPSSGLEVFSSNEHPGERYPGAIIKRGKWVPIVEYTQTVKKALEDREF